MDTNTFEIFMLMSLYYCFQLALSIGQSYLLLANTSLDALEYWSETLPPHVIRPYYPHILPCLDAYLKTPDAGKGTFKHYYLLAKYEIFLHPPHHTNICI